MTVTSSNWLDFDGGPDHDADKGILKEFFPGISTPTFITYAEPAQLLSSFRTD